MTKTFEDMKKEAYEKASMKSYGNTAGSIQMRHLLNELENAGLLKSHQPLPVMPEFVAEWYEEYKDDIDFSIFEACISLYDGNSSDLKKWFGNSENKSIETLIRMKDGYTVEKEKRYYLKNKLTTSYLALENKTGYYCHVSPIPASNHWKTSFTQQEIDSMQTGSYELVPVEDGE